MNLFAYGTLMWPEVLESVTGERPGGRKAVLRGYRRLRVKGETYPVVVESEEDVVEGILYRGLSAAAFELLDRFEGAEYDRVHIDLNGTAVFVYVVAHDWKHIIDSRLWNPADMRPEDLAAFCSEYKGWNEMQS
jgi:gamma-glutamylcyclotransferase (GGCT)/AIG2-like uncharacterized protein YtfP